MQLFCKITAIGLAAACISLHATGQIGIGTATPDPLSILHIFSTDKGVLVPHLSPTQMKDLSDILTTSEKGMLITDASTGKLMGWSGKTWTDPANLTVTTPLAISSTNLVSINPGTQAGDLISWDGNNWISTQPAVQHFSYTVDNRQPYIALNFCIAIQGIFPARNDGDAPFVSEIDLFPFNFPPKGWAQCDGQLLPIAQYTAVFSLVGTYYGGDGKTTFGLPDLRGRVPVSQGQGPGLSPYDQGTKTGGESSTIAR